MTSRIGGFADVEEVSWLRDFVEESPKSGNSILPNLSTESDIIIFSRRGNNSYIILSYCVGGSGRREIIGISRVSSGIAGGSEVTGQKS